MTIKKKNPSPRQSRLKKILKQVSGDASNIEGDLIPQMTIRGSGVVYCYEPSAREFVKVTRGTAVFVVEEENKVGKILIYTCEGLLVEIEAAEIEHIGFD
jgi:hypothetical protein